MHKETPCLFFYPRFVLTKCTKFCLLPNHLWESGKKGKKEKGFTHTKRKPPFFLVSFSFLLFCVWCNSFLGDAVVGCFALQHKKKGRTKKKKVASSPLCMWVDLFFFLSCFLFELIKKANHYNKTFKGFVFWQEEKKDSFIFFPHPLLFPFAYELSKWGVNPSYFTKKTS